MRFVTDKGKQWNTDGLITSGMDGKCRPCVQPSSVDNAKDRIESEVGTTEADQGVNTNFYTTSSQTRRAHCDVQNSDTPQCMETDVIENNAVDVVHVGPITVCTWKDDLDVGTGDQVIMLGYASDAGLIALKLKKKPEMLERKSVNPLTMGACVFKATAS